jgi:branched-chain amino acid transport system ATP-binding protein
LTEPSGDLASSGTLAAEPAASLVLDVSEICVSYGAIEALHGVSLRIGKGQVVALIGSNGAGKTSTLRAISGMLRPSAGRVQFRGEDTTSLKSHLLVQRGMAHAPEGRGIFHNLSVAENLDLGAYLRKDKAAIIGDRDYCFALFPLLKERYRQMAGTLSGGEQQMLAIARALMSRPELLLLDEPSLGLAPQIVERIFVTLREVNARGVSILLVEQNAHLALSLAHHAYVLETGEIVLQGTGVALLEHPSVRAAYLGEI